MLPARGRQVRCVCRARQGERERCPAALAFVRLDATAMQLHDSLADRKAEPGAASHGFAMGFREELVRIDPAEARPAIIHLDAYSFCIRTGADVNVMFKTRIVRIILQLVTVIKKFRIQNTQF